MAQLAGARPCVTRVLGLALAMAGACGGVSPLTNRIAVGREPFAVFVGEGPDGWTDLFAVTAEGGEAVRFTFTRDAESHPAIHPDGAAVAFFRRTTTGHTVVSVINLINAAEREAELPAAMGSPRALGWSRGGDRLFIGGDRGVASSPAPPGAFQLEVLGPDDPRRAEADSALRTLLGAPPFARVEPCDPGARDFCVVAGDQRQSLGAAVTSPARWGPDSVAYVDGGRITVRPLGPGRARVLDLVRAPEAVRGLAYWGGL